MLQQFAQQRVVERVAGFVGLEGADDGVAQQVQVADGVEHLVFDELVVVAQAVLVQDPVFVHHDGVVEGAAGPAPSSFRRSTSRRKPKVRARAMSPGRSCDPRTLPPAPLLVG